MALEQPSLRREEATVSRDCFPRTKVMLYESAGQRTSTVSKEDEGTAGTGNEALRAATNPSSVGPRSPKAPTSPRKTRKQEVIQVMIKTTKRTQ